MKIYAEWFLYGKFHNAFFPSWESYYEATFNPDIELKVLKVLK